MYLLVLKCLYRTLSSYPTLHMHDMSPFDPTSNGVNSRKGGQQADRGKEDKRDHSWHGGCSVRGPVFDFLLVVRFFLR